jgi:hypothetical protein
MCELGPGKKQKILSTERDGSQTLPSPPAPLPHPLNTSTQGWILDYLFERMGEA